MIDKIAKMLGANQNQVNDVFSKAKSIPQTKDALVDLINKNGGVASLNKAKQLLNNPLADKVLGQFGFNAKELKSALNEINGTSNSNTNNNFKNRLNKMK